MNSPASPDILKRFGLARGISEFFIIAAVILLSWGLGLNEFFVLDDFPLLEGSWNTWLQSSGGGWLNKVFLGSGIIDYNYRPLSTHVVFLLLQRLFGPKPWAFHALSLVCLLLTAMSLGAILRRMGVGRGAALVASVFYVTRDALVGFVSWASGIQDGLMTACAVGSLWAMLVRTQSPRRRWSAISLLLFGAALLSKETAVILPLLATVLAWATGPAADRQRTWRRAMALSAGHWALLAIYLCFRVLVIGVNFVHYSIGVGEIAYLRPGAYAFWTVVAGYRWPWWDGFLVSSLLGWALIFFVAVALVLRRKCRDSARSWAIEAGCLWWLIGVIVVTLQIQRFQMYYLSLPAAGAALALGAWIDEWRLLEARSRRHLIFKAGVTSLCFVPGAVLIVLKLSGTVPSGDFYNPRDGRNYLNMYRNISSIPNGLSDHERVAFLGFVDWETILANPDGAGYGQSSVVSSMLRVMSHKPDLEVYYVFTDTTPLPPPERAPRNMVSIGEFRRRGLATNALLLSFNERMQKFERVATLIPSGEEP